MQFFSILIILLSILLSSIRQHPDLNDKLMNKLTNSSSPYLKQHADNPVHWQEWGDEALDMARELNKPLIISIGYAACHWCHVMEHESFSDKEVADFMNENFVCIKVDREERPDIDKIYMEAVQLISGSGGWPLNAFALPDGRPFYAGTYYPKERWLVILKHIAELYNNNEQKVIGYAGELTSGINKDQLPAILKNEDTDFTTDDYIGIKDAWLNHVDFKNGGFSGAPKFPLPVAWEFLLQYYYFTDDPEVLEAVKVTLDEMAKGGIYDQIGGGFARYSVDTYWKVPHFEKMLYDNAQLVSLYSHAYQITGSSRYREIVEQTLSFIDRELTSPENGFYSSLNADSEGEEGKHYIFTLDEINSIVDENNSDIIVDYYQLTKDGNWENGNNILLPVSSKIEFATKHKIEPENFMSILQEADKQLLQYREKRERPSIDNKILTAWNSLMIVAYIDSYKAINTDAYLIRAIKNARFIESRIMKENGELMRNYMDGQASIGAFLDDYALFSNACIELYQVTFDKHWLELAEALVNYCIDHFYDNDRGLFFYTSDLSDGLIARKFELSDNVIPSSNSIMANVLLKLGHLYSNDKFKKMSVRMISHQIENIKSSGQWYSNWAILYGNMCYKPTEVVVVGKHAVAVAREMQDDYLPNSLFLGGAEENLPLLKKKYVINETLIYVCKNKVCRLPVDDIPGALIQINQYKNRHL